VEERNINKVLSLKKFVLFFYDFQLVSVNVVCVKVVLAELPFEDQPFLLVVVGVEVASSS
jgi:hypothetical protein